MASAISPMQQCYYPIRDSMLMFGSEGSCSSSDGSCSQGREIKQEEMGYQSYNDSNNLMLSCYSNMNDGGCFSETLTPLDCDLEEIKQLIRFNNADDENKTEEKAMYQYYY